MRARKGKEKMLHIETPEDLITDIMGEYCNEAGIDEQEIGFIIGHITGRAGDTALPDIVRLTRLFFNAGLYLGTRKGKKRYNMKYLTIEEIKRRTEQTRKKNMERIRPGMNKLDNASYVG